MDLTLLSIDEHHSFEIPLLDGVCGQIQAGDVHIAAHAVGSVARTKPSE